MKYHLIFVVLLLSTLCFAQSFEYQRTWGTYYGPATSAAEAELTKGGIYTNPLNPDQVHIKSNVLWSQANFPASYYNQYITPGAQPINMNYITDKLHGSFIGGNIETSTYILQSGANYPIWDYQIGFDSTGKSLHYKNSAGPLSGSGTPNTWYPADPHAAGYGNHSMLYKKDGMGNLLWSTYLPEEIGNMHFVQDEADNIYIIGDTKIQQGLATSNTYKPNFELYYPPGSNGTPANNGYVAKLNANGVLQWASYLPVGGVRDLAYYNNHLYIVTANDVNPANANLATPGTWQTAKAHEALLKMDTATGNRVWGTYIGNPSMASTFVLTGIQANANGVFLLGNQLYYGNGDFYFATPGAFKTQITGYSDLFLTRLSLDGNRIWGTYFGSDGYDGLLPNNPIALAGNHIFIAGSASGDASNIATPGAFKSTKPNNTAGADNLFFAKFDIDGNQQWCSYYGGPGNNSSAYYSSIGIMTVGTDTFYLYGATTATQEIATPDAFQTQLSPNNSTYTNGFVARFDLIAGMGTAEADLAADLQLYDNPNNGNFSLSGSVLAKEICTATVYDAAGRIVYQTKLPKKKTASIDLSGKLAAATYIIEVENSKDNKLKVFKMVVI